MWLCESSPSRLNVTPRPPHPYPGSTPLPQSDTNEGAIVAVIRPRFALSVLPLLYQVQKQGPTRSRTTQPNLPTSFGISAPTLTRQHISFASAPRHISDSNDFPRHHQLKTPHLGADRLAYLSSLGVKHTWACINHRWGGGLTRLTRMKTRCDPSGVRLFRTISNELSRLVLCDDATYHPQGHETSILRPSTARA